MNLQKTYMELIKKETDDYYIELAQQEILIVPMLIEIMLDYDNTQSRWAERLLERISEAEPMLVYPYFDYICTAFEKIKGVTAWNCWKIIANILSVDLFNHWETLREKYLLTLSSDMITQFLIALSVAEKIIDAKSEDRELIISSIEKSREIDFKICGEVSENSRKIADEAVQSFFESLAG